MRILLDECLDRRLARALTGHIVKTVPKMGWAGIKNGALLALAEIHFDVFLTIDRHLPARQQLSKFKIAVIVLQTASNRLPEVLPMIPKVEASLPKLQPGKALFLRG